MGQWAAAAAEFAKAFELEEPKKPLPWFEHAYLRLQLGDQKGYQRICRRLLERLGQSERDWDVDLLAHTCVLAPGALKEASQVVALAEKRLARTGPENRWSLQVVGLAYYRAAKYDKAVEVLAKAVKDHPDFAPNIANWLILSMAHQHLKQPAEARQWLKQAVARIKELQPKDRFAPEGWEWRDWLGVHLLRREAEGLLNAAKDSGKDRK